MKLMTVILGLLLVGVGCLSTQTPTQQEAAVQEMERVMAENWNHWVTSNQLVSFNAPDSYLIKQTDTSGRSTVTVESPDGQRFYKIYLNQPVDDRGELISYQTWLFGSGYIQPVDTKTIDGIGFVGYASKLDTNPSIETVVYVAEINDQTPTTFVEVVTNHFADSITDKFFDSLDFSNDAAGLQGATIIP